MSVKLESIPAGWTVMEKNYFGLWTPMATYANTLERDLAELQRKEQKMRELDAWLEKQCQPLWPEALKPVVFETKRLTSIEPCSWLGEKLLREPWKAVVFPIAGQERPLYVQVMDRVPFRDAYEVLFTFNGEAEYLELDALDVKQCESAWIWAWADEAFIRE